MSNIAKVHKVAVIATNMSQDDPSVMFGDPLKYIGGHVVGHESTYIIYLKKFGKKRIARMEKSPHQPQAECVFQLGEGGIEDVEVK